ncbi:fz domain-containing protein [Ditylenchus destructor]|nr:fz domain-containing protein [Ditylenchus destructor]
MLWLSFLLSLSFFTNVRSSTEVNAQNRMDNALSASDSAFRQRNRRHSSASKCERITANHCLDIGYNTTRFPNFAGDDSAASALEDFATFEPLISVKCSEHLKFFLCSVYFPMCTEKVPLAIGPCRPLCESVRDSCISVLKEFGFPWPPSLNCSKFASSNNEDNMCMGGPEHSDGVSDNVEMDESGRLDSVSNVAGHRRPYEEEPSYFSLGAERDINYAEELKKYVLPGHKCVLPTAMVYINRTGQCVPHCSSSHGYSHSDLNSAKFALVVASILSASLTSVCLVMVFFRQRSNLHKSKHNCVKTRHISGSGATSTFLVSNYIRLLPLEKSLFFCALSFASSALLYLFSVFQKDKIACTHYTGHNLFIVAGMQHVPCTLMATLLYYSGSAGRLWWLILCCSWRVALKQRSRIDIKKFIFRAHCLAWSVPLALCILALMGQAIQADPLSGVCMVGGANRLQHQIFISGRDGVILVTSFLILVSGCLTTATTSAGTTIPASINYMGNGQGATIKKAKPLSSVTGGLILSILYPLVTSFWLVASIHYIFNSNVPYQHERSRNNNYYGGWGLISAGKLLADPSLGIIIGVGYFIYILHGCWTDLNAQDEHSTPQQPGGNLLVSSKLAVNAPLTDPNGTNCGLYGPSSTGQLGMPNMVPTTISQAQHSNFGTATSYRMTGTVNRSLVNGGYQPLSQMRTMPANIHHQNVPGVMASSMGAESNNTAQSLPLPPPPPPLSALPNNTGVRMHS